MGKDSLSSTMNNVPKVDKVGGGIHDHHIVPCVGQAADRGPDDVSLKFFEDLKATAGALSSPMGTAAKG